MVHVLRRDCPNVNLKIWAAVRPPGGRWRSRLVGGRVALSDLVGSAAAPGPKLGAVLIWEQRVGKNRTAVEDALVGSEGHVGSPHVRYVQRGAPSGDPPMVTFAADGTATVAWEGGGSVFAGRLSPTGSIRSVQRVGKGCFLGDLAENDTGAAAMTLSCPTKPARFSLALRVAERRPGGRFGLLPALPLAPSGDVAQSAVEVSPLGQVTAMWSQTPPGLNESSTAALRSCERSRRPAARRTSSAHLLQHVHR